MEATEAVEEPTMLERILIPALIALSAFVASSVDAHEVYRFVGTVVKWVPAKNTLDITTADTGAKVLHIVLRDSATVMRDKKKVARSELKPGLSVVVDAVGVDLDDIEGVDIKIVPTPRKVVGQPRVR
jgi:hypothetical protein